ncbi:MAG: hypothetical protein ACREOU_04390 [Candidatus Eiseniibacteriota bacterium]
MRKLLTSLVLLGALGVVHQAHAAIGTVDASWDACAPIVVDKTTTVAGPVGLVISILGHDEFHQGYEVWGILGTAARTTPDAWAFDAAGCQTPAGITIDHLSPVALSKTCPSFQGNAASVQIKAYDTGAGSGDLQYDPNLRRLVLANAYPAGISTSLATQRYFLARFLFDHSFSVPGPGTPGVDCGGYENAICFTMLGGSEPGSVATGKWWAKVNYLDQAGATRELPVGNRIATFNNAGNPMGCAAVPAVNKTWGQIKSQYRN